MASIVIVTRQCYLVCESINYISVHEVDEEDKAESLFYSPPPPKKYRKKPTAKQQLLDKLKRAAQLYQIQIDFVPTQGNNSNNSRNNNGNSSVTITVRGYDRCLDLFGEMINQIREQQPDKLFLDKMVEKFFADNPIEKDAV